MKNLSLIIFALTWSISAYTETDNTHYRKVSSQPLKIESRTTEPTPLPDADMVEITDPVDHPPVLEYAQTPTVERAPANVAPTRFVDNEFGIACYYILQPTLSNVVTAAAPSISCVKIAEPKRPAPAVAPAAATSN